MESQTKLINLVAGPGAGKSTVAAGLFYTAKSMGINCELVTEYAKKLVWQDHLETIKNNQLKILGTQYEDLLMLKNKVDLIITDSPLLLAAYYAKRTYQAVAMVPEKFISIINEFANGDFQEFYYFVFRRKAYNPSGRMQTEEEAIKIDQELRLFFDTILPKQKQMKEIVTSEDYVNDITHFEWIIKEVMENKRR